MSGHVFISYARNDDLAVKENLDSKGFVAALHDRLLAYFDDLGPPAPTVFRDTKQIDPSDQFEPRLGQALDAAKLMIVVLSRNWLASEWCGRELATFVGNWQKRGESEQDVRERLILVLKHMIQPEDRPAWLQGQSGYALVRVDKENGDEIEFFKADLGQASDEWFRSINALAKDLRRRVVGDEDQAGASDAPRDSQDTRTASRMTVYLAQPAADMEACHATLLEELRHREIRVVPDTDLPMQGEPAIAMIDAALGQSRLSIHLLGDKLGFQPEDAAPIVRLQLDRAAAKAAATAPGATEPAPFQRLIWTPRLVPGSDGRRDMYDVLARHSQASGRKGDSVVDDTLAKFRDFILQRLESIARPRASQAPSVAAGSQIYVQHHEQDSIVAESVAESLKRLGFAPLLPILAGDTAERLRVHRDLLKIADAVVLCWALATPLWVRANASELRDSKALGRGAAFKTRAVVALPPQAPDKERLRKFPYDLDSFIDGTRLKELGPDQLDSLLSNLLGGTLERPGT